MIPIQWRAGARIGMFHEQLDTEGALWVVGFSRIPTPLAYETNGSACDAFLVRKCSKLAGFEELGQRVEKPVSILSATEVQ